MVSGNTIIKSFERVTGESYGARFYRTDLHFHTPASDDARGDNKYYWDFYDLKFPKKGENSQEYYEKVKQVQDEILEASRKLARDMVQRFRKEKLSLVAITDHNSIGTISRDPESTKDIMDLAAPTWYELIDDEAQKLNKDRTVLTILPGVEISTSDIHILAIFPPQTPRRKAHFIICDLLNEVGFKMEEWGDNLKAGKTSVYRTIELITKQGGLPIIAHADAHDKALLELYKINSAAMKDVLTNKHLSALEIVNPSNFEKLNQKVKKPLSTWIYSLRKKHGLSSFAYFHGSDAHSLEQIAKRSTYVKMTEPSFPGLKIALHIPSSRVRLYDDVQKAIKQEKCGGLYIYGMEINHPYFKRRVVRFNRHLNCVVGKPESRKTTLFQLMQKTFTTNDREIQGSIKFFIEEIKKSKSKYYMIGKDSRNHYLYSLDKSDKNEPVVKKRVWNELKDLDITPCFYEPDIVNRWIDCGESFNKFIRERFGPPNEQNIQTLNKMFAIPLFLEKEKHQLLYAEADGNNYKLHLDVQWNRGKEKKVEFSELDNSLRRMIFICVTIISGTTGPLIIDAPEGYFNNHDIVNYLIPIIKKYKDIRQIILFTNHPLLAINTDPEHHILLEQKKYRGEKVGRIEPMVKKEQREQLVNLVEGSSRAFNKRKIHYDMNGI
jgi:histidinol phosphatase-like PHP family hydrolase